MSVVGCAPAVLDPQGPVGAAARTILYGSLAIMLSIVIPTIVATLGFAWWFRASNTKARYLPSWVYSGQLELLVWSVPLLTITLLGGVAWIGSHALDPARPLASDQPAVEVQVVSLDWKWLFIYPGQGVAAVNELVIPAGTPIHFTLTSGSVLNAFFVPQLGSMIYTMNGMATQLWLQADNPGTYHGQSSHFSGDHFSDMHFEVRSLDQAGFEAWVAKAKATGEALDGTTYAGLAKQGVVQPATYRAVEEKLFDRIVSQEIAPGPGPGTGPSPPGKWRSRMLGKLSWDAIPLSEPIPMVASAVVALTILGVLVWITVKGWLPYLWHEWITSVDHKRIGVMYVLLAMVMLLRGFSDAIMMRSQQALAYRSEGFLPPDHYNQIFSAHGTLMIFFVAMPFMIGLMNLVVPLQLGARDVAFPTLNSVSFWLTATGALLVNISLVVGEFARTGWLPYPPLSELTYSPGVGVDYYLWSLQISGVGTLLSGVNLVTTVLKIHAPGMTYLRMPMFCWTTLAANLLIVAAFPILTATLAMLLLDRYLGFHFFTNEAGGNVMMFMNLIWAWGHPEVYILILPAFGIFSEVISTFSQKPLFGYRSMVLATMVICVLSFMVWLHHFFTMGAGADVNAVFGVATMVIAVPTGVKIFNWLFTMYGGRIVYATPVLWAIGFMVTFVIGGMTGVLLAVPPADFVLHNSLFLVAHFHNVVIGGVLFGAFAGYTYWFPKAFGFSLDEKLGKAAFWCWISGFYLAFMPLYVLGLMGMTRRMQHYDVAAWRPWLLVAGCGALLILAGIVCQILQLVVSIRRRAELVDLTGDPWNGRSLEWAVASPPPVFNFAVLPDVQGEEAYWEVKQRALEQQKLSEVPEYEEIEMPRNSPTGFFCAFFATIMGFALIWHIWWMVAVSFVGAWAVFVVFAWRDRAEYVIPAEEVARVHGINHAARRDALTRLAQQG